MAIAAAAVKVILWEGLRDAEGYSHGLRFFDFACKAAVECLPEMHQQQGRNAP
jgi:hypothetical protein